MSNTTKGLLFDPVIDSESEILAIRAQAKALALQGAVYMEYTGEGTSFSKRFSLPVEQVLSETRYCLKQMNPAKYGRIITSLKPYHRC